MVKSAYYALLEIVPSLWNTKKFDALVTPKLLGGVTYCNLDAHIG
jgi:hypothetical protein